MALLVDFAQSAGDFRLCRRFRDELMSLPTMLQHDADLDASVRLSHLSTATPRVVSTLFRVSRVPLEST
ncbi:hypothetical protein MPTK1_4g01060 [Marchantia polymorpha subsp. ruderalis]|uniref:Uncharacterized protein n=2 Tax=Marchantia polymorpha TaxID=3197 RepID=A0AAF6B521_MARPO|nr:hypothetical protein MARPO_0066s0037 [Marchantia polymorpha]BBN07105.1 hypothetical protein Mp_4g01060 [Marchantia polymorpha subsp. ruderalis]|eukprot:PTQ36079.1 hypothetical protein MARPO_0066s0037 [Marchantia polymorpha]